MNPSELEVFIGLTTSYLLDRFLSWLWGLGCRARLCASSHLRPWPWANINACDADNKFDCIMICMKMVRMILYNSCDKNEETRLEPSKTMATCKTYHPVSTDHNWPLLTVDSAIRLNQCAACCTSQQTASGWIPRCIVLTSTSWPKPKWADWAVCKNLNKKSEESEGFTWVYLGLPGFTWVYLGLPGFTWVYLGLPVTKRFSKGHKGVYGV